ncbi:glycoside hydrolase family 3 protein [Bacteroidota bacterium]
MKVTIGLVLLAAGLAIAGLATGIHKATIPENEIASGSQDSLRIMIGQMLLVGFRGKSVDEQHSIFRDISERGIGGVILFDYDVPSKKSDRNIESPEQVRSLTSKLQEWSGIPLLIAIDQEGGRVNRLKERYGFPRSVSAGYLGTIDNPDSTRFYADRTASVLSEIGVNLNFAPVVDLNLNPENPIIGKIERSFSADPEVVVRNAALVVRSHTRQGIMTSLKHFPGHGSSTGDTHKGLVDVSETWQESELLPYRMLLDSGLVHGVMTAHVVNRQLDSAGASSTLSSTVIGGILREEMKYDNVVFSDDLQMGAIRDHYDLDSVVRLALEAGVDVLTFGNNSVYEPDIAARVIEIIVGLVEHKVVTKSRIEESYTRIMELKAKTAPR